MNNSSIILRSAGIALVAVAAVAYFKTPQPEPTPQPKAETTLPEEPIKNHESQVDTVPEAPPIPEPPTPEPTPEITAPANVSERVNEMMDLAGTESRNVLLLVTSPHDAKGAAKIKAALQATKGLEARYVIGGASTDDIWTTGTTVSQHLELPHDKSSLVAIQVVSGKFIKIEKITDL